MQSYDLSFLFDVPYLFYFGDLPKNLQEIDIHIRPSFFKLFKERIGYWMVKFLVQCRTSMKLENIDPCCSIMLVEDYYLAFSVKLVFNSLQEIVYIAGIVQILATFSVGNSEALIHKDWLKIKSYLMTTQVSPITFHFLIYGM